MDTSFIFSIAVLIMSIVMHEYAHAVAAVRLGDPTPSLQGRLTLNPVKHLEFFGSLLLPTLSYMLGGFIFGWAKPVMINLYNLRPQRFGEAIVAFAGPFSNICLAVIFAFVVRMGETLSLPGPFIELSLTIVIVNCVLAVFNLIPLPPLDGSKILFAFLPQRLITFRRAFEGYGMILVILLIPFFGYIVSPVVRILVSFLI